MIDINLLRVGNYVTWKNKIFIVLCISENKVVLKDNINTSIHCVNIECIEKLQATKDNIENLLCLVEDKPHNYTYNNTNLVFNLFSDNTSRVFRPIRQNTFSVHDIQNKINDILFKEINDNGNSINYRNICLGNYVTWKNKIFIVLCISENKVVLKDVNDNTVHNVDVNDVYYLETTEENIEKYLLLTNNYSFENYQSYYLKCVDCYLKYYHDGTSMIIKPIPYETFNISDIQNKLNNIFGKKVL